MKKAYDTVRNDVFLGGGGEKQERCNPLTKPFIYCIIIVVYYMEAKEMKHIQTVNTRDLCESAKNGGCGECQTSCQSACKTSCGIANQKCENTQEKESK